MKRYFTALFLALLIVSLFGGEQYVLATECASCCPDNHCTDCYLTEKDNLDTVAPPYIWDMSVGPVLLNHGSILFNLEQNNYVSPTEINHDCLVIDKRSHPAIGPPAV